MELCCNTNVHCMGISRFSRMFNKRCKKNIFITGRVRRYFFKQGSSANSNGYGTWSWRTIGACVGKFDLVSSRFFGYKIQYTGSGIKTRRVISICPGAFNCMAPVSFTFFQFFRKLTLKTLPFFFKWSNISLDIFFVTFWKLCSSFFRKLTVNTVPFFCKWKENPQTF